MAAAFSMSGESSEHEAVRDEQTRLVWLHATFGSAMATLFAAFLAWHLRAWVAFDLVVAWIVVKLVTALPRMIQAQVYRRRGYPSGERWRRSTDLMLALDGLVWGVGGFWMMSGDVEVAALVGACLTGVAAVATFGLQVSARSTAAYVLPILLPLIGGLLARGDQFGVLVAAGLAIFLGLMLITAVRSAKHFAEVHLLRAHTAKISDELRAALELAERQSAAKTQFLATVTHELRTPVHGLIGIAKLVHAESRDKTVRRHMEALEASASDLLSLVKDLLDIARIEVGQISTHTVVFNLTNEVNKLADVYSVRSAEKGLRFTLDNALDEHCWLEGDPSRTRQVLHNLLGNAVKFTDKGWIELTVRKSASPTRGLVEFIVRDTGVGIDPADQDRVFQAFEQVAFEGRPKRRMGTGLGLTIAREIAHRLGGDITLESRVGFGSIFRFTAEFKPASPAQARATIESARHLDRASSVGLRVLLAEDDEVNAIVAIANLQLMGHQVERASNGAEAVQRALRESSRPQLVLMDCNMPQMNGYDATRSIRQQEEALGLERVPIVALSGAIDPHGQETWKAAGMDDFLNKPFTTAELQAAIAPYVDSISTDSEY